MNAITLVSLGRTSYGFEKHFIVPVRGIYVNFNIALSPVTCCNLRESLAFALHMFMFHLCNHEDMLAPYPFIYSFPHVIFRISLRYLWTITVYY